MTRYALLCGSAPEGMIQKKIDSMHDFLVSEQGGAWQEREIMMFPNGMNELFLESVLNGVFDEAAEEDESEILLYFCARTDADLSAELSDCACAGVEVIRLGEDEIRKDVIAYYAESLAEMLGVNCRVVCETDGEFVSEEMLGYARVGER